VPKAFTLITNLSVRRGRAKRKVGRVIDTVRTHGDTCGQAQNDRLIAVSGLVVPIAAPASSLVAASATSTTVMFLPSEAAPSSATATATTGTNSTTESGLVLGKSARLGTMIPALVRLHAAADGFRGDTGAYLNVRLLDTESVNDGTAARAAVGGREHPFAVGLSEFVDGDDTDPALVVATVARAKANAPSGLDRLLVKYSGGRGRNNRRCRTLS
jgi:hypothetical protein